MKYNSNATFTFDASDRAITSLSMFGFTIQRKLDCDVGDVRQALLIVDGQPLEVDVRVRSIEEAQSDCTFVDLPISQQQVLSQFLKDRERINVGTDDLTSRSYDELAAGLTTTDAAGPPKRAKSHLKSLVLLVMLLVFVGLVVIATLFMRSKSSLSVANSSLVGNYVPVHARTEGELVEVNVSEGDFVQRGDVLCRLRNTELQAKLRDCESEMESATAKVAALEKQLGNYRRKVKVATKKLDIDIAIAKKQAKAVGRQMEASKALVDRMKPYVEKSVARLEFDVANNEHLALQAQYESAQSEIKVKEFARDMSEENILILGDRLDDEFGRIQADLEIAIAEREHLARKADILAEQESQLEILAPRDGFVFAAYRQYGEFLKTADEAIAISYPGETWASGMVTTSQARRIRPGQPVTVSVPSLDRRMEGIVSAVGHRAMYAKGNYSAEFRGATATDVPVKVYIEDLPQGVPSGMRLEMTVNTGFGLPWLDKLTGFELKEIHREQTANAEDAATPESENPKNQDDPKAPRRFAVSTGLGTR